jgi:phage terminase small subunit
MKPATSQTTLKKAEKKSHRTVKRAEREEIFAREYIIDLNGQAAAERAGYAPKTARITASRLLTKANIRDIIAKLTKEKFAKLDISADWVLGELRKLAGYDAGAIFNDDGSLKPIKGWDASARAALSLILGAGAEVIVTRPD